MACSALQRDNGGHGVSEDLSLGGRTEARLKANGHDPVMRDSWCSRKKAELEVAAVRTRGDRQGGKLKRHGREG